MRASHLLLLTLLLSANASAEALRYIPPTPGRTVFNEVLRSELSAPLRLSKVGQYYAELIIEAPPGATAVALSAPLAVQLVLNFTRHDRVLHSRSVDVSFAPGERSKTLFWLDVPDTLPNRTNLELHVSLRETSQAQLVNAQLRLQLTRKLELAPILLR